MGTTYVITKNGMEFLQDYKEVEREFSKRIKEIQGYLGVYGS